MRRNLRAFALLLLSFFGGVPVAAGSEEGAGHCDLALLSALDDQLNLQVVGDELTDSRVVATACKRWPVEAPVVIVAVAYDDGDEYQKALVIALLNLTTQMVIASHLGVISEDAAMTIGESSLRIDTARYNIAAGIRAFGLDVTTSYSQGCVDGGLGAVRSLYIHEGKDLKPVLENFYVSSWRYVRGGPSCAEKEDVVVEDVSYSISIADESTNGLADLIITAASSEPMRSPFRYTLKYDGGGYPTMDGLNGGGRPLERWRWPEDDPQ